MTDNDNKLNVQPHSEEAELAVLGSMLSSKEAVSKSLESLKPEHFYKEAHEKIFSVMQELFDNSEPIDTLSVSELLKKKKILDNVGGMYFLTGLVEAVPTAAHVEKYSKIVREKAILRNLINLSHKIAKISYDDKDNVSDILDNVESSIFKITQNSLKTGFKQINPIMVDALDELEEKLHEIERERQDNKKRILDDCRKVMAQNSESLAADLSELQQLSLTLDRQHQIEHNSAQQKKMNAVMGWRKHKIDGYYSPESHSSSLTCSLIDCTNQSHGYTYSCTRDNIHQYYGITVLHDIDKITYVFCN